MKNNAEWHLAMAEFSAIRDNVPNSISESFVADYHAILDRMTCGSGESFDAFRIPPTALEPQIVSIRMGTRRSPGSKSYSKDKYCDANLFQRKIDALTKYLPDFERRSQAVPPQSQPTLSRSAPLSASTAKPTPVRVFVSYSHRDKKFLDEFRTALAPLFRDDRINFWDDTTISAGSQWRDEIEAELLGSNVAVLLVSANFLASNFISNVELPTILERARNNSVRIFWIAIGHSLFSASPLNNYQAANDPSRPLDTLDKARRMEIWVKIANEIKNATSVASVAGALGTIDESYNLVRSVISGKEEPPQAHRVAHYSAREEEVTFTGHQQLTVTISGKDLESLDKESLELIQMYEDSMKQRYNRIKLLYPSRILPSGDSDQRSSAS